MSRPNLAVLCGLAVNPAAPLTVLLRLADHPHHGFLAPSRALLDREDLPSDVAEALSVHPDTDVRRRLAGHPSTPREVLRDLAQDPEAAVRAEIAQRPYSSLPDEVYRRLATDTDPAVRAAVARNPAVPDAIREPLAGDADRDVRYAAAQYGLPTAGLHRLLADEDRDVRQAALMGAHVREATIPEELAALFEHHPVWWASAVELVELTPELLARLWPQPDLRAALARNPSLPVEQMRDCLHDSPVALARNPRLPADLLEELVDTEDPQVHKGLQGRKDIPARLRRRLIVAAGENEHMSAVWWLQPEHASLEERLSYLDHPSPVFRRTLATAEDLPSDAVHRLAADPDFATRLLVCECQTDVPPATLVDVLERWTGRSRETLLHHPRLPAEAVHRYANGDRALDRHAIATRADLPPELAIRLTADPEDIVRRAAAANPSLPHDHILRLLADPSPTLREGAAGNPALTVQEIEQLLADSG